MAGPARLRVESGRRTDRPSHVRPRPDGGAAPARHRPGSLCPPDTALDDSRWVRDVYDAIMRRLFFAHPSRIGVDVRPARHEDGRHGLVAVVGRPHRRRAGRVTPDVDPVHPAGATAQPKPQSQAVPATRPPEDDRPAVSRAAALRLHRSERTWEDQRLSHPCQQHEPHQECYARGRDCPGESARPPTPAPQATTTIGNIHPRVMTPQAIGEPPRLGHHAKVAAAAPPCATAATRPACQAGLTDDAMSGRFRRATVSGSPKVSPSATYEPHPAEQGATGCGTEPCDQHAERATAGVGQVRVRRPRRAGLVVPVVAVALAVVLVVLARVRRRRRARRLRACASPVPSPSHWRPRDPRRRTLDIGM